MLHFSIVFNEILSNHKDLKWVTFHGLYDFAYLWRLLGGQNLPNSTSEFAVMLGRIFGFVYDVKYMAKFCEGLIDGELGLERLSKILEVERLGRTHQASSDSLLTTAVFLRMKMVYGFEEECFKGFLLDTYHTIAFDTEFPGFLHRTPRHSSEEKVYEDLKYNVDQTKIVQLGLTLLDDEGNIGGTWQEKRDAVDMLHFSIVFNEMLLNHKDLKWVTFHGLYDFAYLWRLLDGQDLPNSASEFSVMLGRVFGSVYDVKYMARFCEGLMDGELGLERLSNILEVERLGRAHQAGSDSLLTAGVFLRMKMVYGFEEECFKGFLWAKISYRKGVA
ncbi:putative CCR4-associated factor 1 homolog 8 [Diospyros lotus]|uniref:putative CCR4-associated factor 1 homolog 8 n=1 Tax=Diospyros lotus TaxID=55363 RepID=UPI002253353A|nr:putative CCR4-associated factor 1 homolog 8 [Diospyros lotus]